MPNHLHGVIFIVGADLCVCPKLRGEHAGSPLHQNGEHAGSPLPEIIQWFKTMSTNEYIRNVKQGNWPPFNKKIWQRNYYEHIIRNEKSLDKIRNYIFNNPSGWPVDIENLKIHKTITEQQRKNYYRNIF